jgi:SAC3 family protein LENG8/THP3
MTDWDSMPLPTYLQEPKPEPEPVLTKRTIISRFDVEPTAMKRIKSPAPTSNPLSDSDSDSMIIEEKPKKKRKSSFQKYNESISQTKEELERRNQRMARFTEVDRSIPPTRVDTPDYVRDSQIAASITNSLPDDVPFIGRSQVLERPYLRLTTAPDPSVVRPPEVLKQTMELLKKKWRAEGNYSYICDQFKSIRQDLMVQRIKTSFTVQVYELHARIALEKVSILYRD